MMSLSSGAQLEPVSLILAYPDVFHKLVTRWCPIKITQCRARKIILKLRETENSFRFCFVVESVCCIHFCIRKYIDAAYRSIIFLISSIIFFLRKLLLTITIGTGLHQRCSRKLSFLLNHFTNKFLQTSFAKINDINRAREII